eukprot:1158265-Pelagomonas_calceolata.AAC.3
MSQMTLKKLGMPFLTWKWIHDTDMQCLGQQQAIPTTSHALYVHALLSVGNASCCFHSSRADLPTATGSRPCTGSPLHQGPRQGLGGGNCHWGPNDPVAGHHVRVDADPPA